MLALSVGIELVSSSARVTSVKSAKRPRTQLERTGPIDRPQVYLGLRKNSHVEKFHISRKSQNPFSRPHLAWATDVEQWVLLEWPCPTSLCAKIYFCQIKTYRVLVMINILTKVFVFKEIFVNCCKSSECSQMDRPDFFTARLSGLGLFSNTATFTFYNKNTFTFNFPFPP